MVHTNIPQISLPEMRDKSCVTTHPMAKSDLQVFGMFQVGPLALLLNSILGFRRISNYPQ